jgi:hypothetical protein
VKVALHGEVQSASDADLMERPIASLPVADNMVTVHTKPYEIKTIRVKMQLANPATASGNKP